MPPRDRNGLPATGWAREARPRRAEYLGLLRLSGKPECLRPELLEEVDDRLGRLVRDGFLVPNLLPGFYQLRNLTMRLIVNEATTPWGGFGPELLFRRSTNERVGQLLQDVATMLRGLLLSVFERLGREQVEALLRGKQNDRELMPATLNRAILQWAEQHGGHKAKGDLNKVLVEHRNAFRQSNSVWERTQAMMADDEAAPEQVALPAHLRCIDFLTFSELRTVLIDRLDDAFPHVRDDLQRARLKERWRENMPKVQRLRNHVAHLRNVDFRDMEGLVAMVEALRTDLIKYARWR